MTDDVIGDALAEARQTGRLAINGESLAEIPSEVRNIDGLRQLRLTSCALTALPDWLSGLTSLTHIDLAYNPIDSLPSGFGKLKSLRVLGLANTRLVELDEVLCELSSLEALCVAASGLKALPRWIGDLTNLRVLNVGGNPIRELPQEIYYPQRLTHLYLWGGIWPELPTPPRPLPDLEVLDLSRTGINMRDDGFDRYRKFRPPPALDTVGMIGMSPSYGGQLSVLPDSFAQAFPALRALNLGQQRLRSLPPELPPRLSSIFLDGNEIEVFPSAILNSDKFEEVDLGENRLITLPPGIASLSGLTYLNLAGNTLPIPPEVLTNATAPRAIMDYLRRVQGPTRRLDQAKLLVVGEGSVGKTSLIRRLVSGGFSEHEDKTAGIEVSRWRIAVDDAAILVNVWDFGGQEIMHATHQFFLTKRSVYVLVVDARQGDEQNRVEYWLKLIQSFAEASPVVIVVNKTEQAQMDIDSRGLRRKYPNIAAILPTSCKTGEGIEAVKHVLAASVARLPHVRDLLPEAFFEVKRELEQSDADYLSFEDYQRLCRRWGLNDLHAQESLVGFLHDLGTVLCFRDDPRLSDTNILNPEWVTGGVYRLLNSHLAAQRKGLLTWADVNEILDTTDYPPERRKFILDVMKRFELCYESEDTYLIPDLLTKQEPDTGTWADALSFEIRYEVLPSSILSRLIVRMNRWISKETVWRTGLVLAMDRNRGLVTADREDAVVRIAISGPASGRRGMLTAIRAELRAIAETIPGLAAEERVPVPGWPNIWVPHDHLLDLEAAGRDVVIPQGLTEYFKIRDLLAGVETLGERAQDVVVSRDGPHVGVAGEAAQFEEAAPWGPSDAMRMGWWLLVALVTTVGVFVGADLAVGAEAAAAISMAAVVAIISISMLVLRFSGRISEQGLLGALKHLLDK